MNRRSGRPRKVLILFTLFIFADFGHAEKKGVVGLEEEEDSEDSGVIVRSDPSDMGTVIQRKSVSQTNQVIRLGSNEKSRCPHSCFCEMEDSYASCIGDGQWNPPLLPRSMTRLELRSFYLPELEGSSVRLPGLQELQLQQCNLTRLHRDAFIMVPELDRLDLSQNLLENLGPNQLRGLAALRHLDLSSNRLSTLNRPFTHLTGLEHLSLRNNRLKKLDADTFDGLDKVQYVNLDENFIATVNVAAFQHLGSLAHLILSNNPLSNLARLNFFGSRLQYIDVSNIGIEKVPQALTQFVRDLRLAKNNVREIHRGDLDSYPYLGLLVLDDNCLEILEEDALGRHEYLARLWLNGNNLRHIPQSLPMSLKALYIEENQITTLNDGDFSGLTNLEQIFLQRNHISSISRCTFCELINLKSLDLQANNISNISHSVFSKLNKLESLDLSQNPILSLNSDSFEGLSFTRVLQISRIHTNTTISENLLEPLKSLQVLEMYGSPSIVETIVNSSRLLHSLRGLQELNLMHNDLKILRNDFFSFFPKLSLIKLSGNSWDCSEQDKILWLKNWMQSSPINFYRSFSVRCSKPSSLGFKPVLLLEEDDFEQEYTSPVLSTPLPLTSTFKSSKDLHLSNSRDSVEFQPTPTNRSSNADLGPNALFLITNHQAVQTSVNITSPKTFVKIISDNNSSLTDELNTTTEEPNTNFSTTIEQILTKKDYKIVSEKTTSSNKFFISSSTTEISFESPFVSISLQNSTEEATKSATFVLPSTRDSTFRSLPQRLLQSSGQENKRKVKTTIPSQGELSKLKEAWKSWRSRNQTNTPTNHQEEMWNHRSDSLHTFVEGRSGVSVHSLHHHDSAVIVGAGIVSACLGIALILGGFVLARGISRKHRRFNVWENSRSSYWNGREGDGGEFISEGVVVGIGETGTGIMRETEGTVGVVTESHHGLNNRLYLLLQRDTSTGITPETLPDPRVPGAPNIISSESLNNNSRLQM